MSASPVTTPGVRAPHRLHASERVWVETNCYVDLWIELLHSLDLDPAAMLAFTVAIDFEGDQWTFFKPPLEEIRRLYGIDTQELAIWLPLERHVREQVQRGRVVLVEADSFFLPDTADVAYRAQHVKTTIGVVTIDPAEHTIGYFHNAGRFVVSGEDYDGLFGVSESGLPPYAEIAKLDRIVKRNDHELRFIASEMLQTHVARLPETNPVTVFRARFERDTEWLRSEDMSVFHAYAFATLRQCGASAELAGSFLEWLAPGDDAALRAATHFRNIATAAKTMQFKIARMFAPNRQVDVTELLHAMEMSWTGACAALRQVHAD